MKYVTVYGSNGERHRINYGSVVRFKYPVAGHQTGLLLSSNGEYCTIQLELVENGRNVEIERYRSEIII